MKGRNINWLIGCLTLLATLVILASGQLLWEKFAVAKPLDKVLQDIDGVVTATQSEIKGRDEKLRIDVKLHDVKNLQETYREIETGVQSVLGSKPYAIVLQDERTPALEEFYYSIHYFIQEAIFTGNFSVMAERVAEQAQANGVNVKTFVENGWVFVQLQQADGQMYVAVPRPLTTINAGVK